VHRHSCQPYAKNSVGSGGTTVENTADNGALGDAQ
jgi:hypothetical protein